MAIAGRNRAMLSTGRRRRGRAPLLVRGLLFVVVAGLLALGGSRTSPTEARTAALSYLDRVRPIIERSTATGRDLATTRESARTQRPELTLAALDRIVGDANDTVVLARSVNPPKANVLAHDLLVGALAGRAVAVSGIRGSMGRALDPQQPTVSVVEALSGSGKDLADADASYRLFARNLPMGDGSAGAELTAPASAWLPNATDWSSAVLGSYVTALRASRDLTPLHDVAVLLAQVNPAPVTKDATLNVLPDLKAYTVDIVVANQGNQPERELPVVATVTRLDTTEVTVTRDQVDLEAGGRKAITLTLRPPPVNVQFSLSVRIGPIPGVDQPVNPIDDELIQQFVIR